MICKKCESEMTLVFREEFYLTGYFTKNYFCKECQSCEIVSSVRREASESERNKILNSYGNIL